MPVLTETWREGKGLCPPGTAWAYQDRLSHLREAGPGDWECQPKSLVAFRYHGPGETLCGAWLSPYGQSHSYPVCEACVEAYDRRQA